MKLVKNWRKIGRHAHSVKLMALAAVLAGLEAALPLFDDIFGLGPRWFAAITFIIIAGALFSRFIVQEKISGATDD